MSNGTMAIARELLQDLFCLPDTIGIVGVEFDGRTVTLRLHDVTQPDSANAVYCPKYRRKDYELVDLGRTEC